MIGAAAGAEPLSRGRLDGTIVERPLLFARFVTGNLVDGPAPADLRV